MGSRFFQSHYFHRERNPAEPITSAASQINDPFADCVRMDEKDMHELMEKGRKGLKRHLDLTYINEDLGILSEMRSVQISLRGSSEAKRLLVRRCNYHSERVLSTMEEDDQQMQQKLFALPVASSANRSKSIENESSAAGSPKINGGTSSIAAESSKPAETFDLELESQELAELERPSIEYSPLNAYNPQQVTSDKPKAEEKERARKLLAATLENSGSVLENQEAFFDILTQIIWMMSHLKEETKQMIQSSISKGSVVLI